MRILIAGGHGKVALLLSRLLRDSGHEPTGVIRNPDHADDVRAAGAEPLVLDLESAGLPDVVSALDGADAAVFAAGSGPGSGAARKLTMDRDGAVLLVRAAVEARVQRFVMVSSMGANGRLETPADADDFAVYLRAKGEADDALRATDLDWTVVRPGGLTDDGGTGRVTAGEHVGRGSIPRADVAAVLAHVLVEGVAVRRQFELVGGATPIGEALSD